MDAVDIQARVQDCPAHIGYKLNAKLSHLLVVILDRFQDVQEMLWNDSIRHPRGLLETIPVLDGHDAWDDRDCDTRPSDGLHPTDEEVHVKEHLGEDPGTTEVGFCLEVFEFFLKLFWGEEGVFWKAGNSDIEVVAVVFLDVSNEVDSMDKATVDRLPDLFPGRRVPSKSQNIATPVLFGSLGNTSVFERRCNMVRTHRKGYVDLFGLHVGTCQMHTCLETNRPLAELDHFCCEFGSASSRMPEVA